jgi:hypothetical protein
MRVRRRVAVVTAAPPLLALGLGPLLELVRVE